MNVRDTVLNLLIEDPSYEGVIKEIVELEQQKEGFQGWKPSDARIIESELSKLAARNILEELEGDEGKYKLKDRRATKQALDYFWIIEKAREKMKEDERYRNYLEEVLAAQRRNPLKTDARRYGVHSGFRNEDVRVPAQSLTRLCSIGVIEKASSREAVYTVPDPWLIEKILEMAGPEREGKWLESVVVDEEDEEEFQKIIEEETPLEYWAERIAPKVVEMEGHKKALLIALASMGDLYGDRNRTHVLFYGDPGTAKSALIRWVSSRLEVGFCSHRTTDVGLTGDARGNAITPGALPRNHGGALCIDELDEFDDSNRAGLLEAMSDGEVVITAGGMEEAFPAEARVIACTNRIEEFRPEFLDRFDFQIECRIPRGERKKRIIHQRIKDWNKPKEGYSGVKFKKYLKWIQDFTPTLSDRVREKAWELFESELLERDSGQSPRQYERYIRIACAIARLNKRNVCVEDFRKAISLVEETSL